MTKRSMDVKNKLESLLFISHKPLSLNELVKLLTEEKSVIEAALAELQNEYQTRAGGIEILQVEDKFQMAASGDNAELIAKFLNTEMAGDLTKPSLETLTIIAYRGPISKVELAFIISCSACFNNNVL